MSNIGKRKKVKCENCRKMVCIDKRGIAYSHWCSDYYSPKIIPKAKFEAMEEVVELARKLLSELIEHSFPHKPGHCIKCDLKEALKNLDSLENPQGGVA